ncbi:uroporphyrinogen-III synthase [Tabrizicola sp.]|uniref:uroporphyrinogen-III synthase n=1 Tax=Tabrizicola sp. TaxID=2005166 RepID=UPI002735FD7F|nr:uroporphyrinogen-III synthase [Tabrizicola sp.]
MQPVLSPLLVPRNLTPPLPDRDYAAVIFTSAQAVPASRAMTARLPSLAWCVGRKTAEAATAAGFRAKSADGDAKALVAAITADPPDGSILYLRGVDTASNILSNLRNIGFHTDEAVVYVQEPQSLAPQALALLREPVDVIVPLFSPRTARLFRAALPDDTSARLHIAAMSGTVADALGDLSCVVLTIASHPDGPAMLDAVETLLVGLPPP